MRYLALVALAVLASCGDSTGVSVADRLSIVGGNFQSGVVTQRLGNPLRVEASAGARAASGQMVCWVAVTEGAGAPFLPCATTDGDGVAETPWDLGTLAGDHLVQARAVVEGEPVAVADYVLEARPGEAVALSLVSSGGPHSVGDTVRVVDLVREGSVRDAYGNVVPRESITETLWVSGQWQGRGRTFTIYCGDDTEGTKYSGTGDPVPVTSWALEVPDFGGHDGYEEVCGERWYVSLVLDIGDIQNGTLNFTVDPR